MTELVVLGDVGVVGVLNNHFGNRQQVRTGEASPMRGVLSVLGWGLLCLLVMAPGTALSADASAWGGREPSLDDLFTLAGPEPTRSTRNFVGAQILLDGTRRQRVYLSHRDGEPAILYSGDEFLYQLEGPGLARLPDSARIYLSLTAVPEKGLEAGEPLLTIPMPLERDSRKETQITIPGHDEVHPMIVHVENPAGLTDIFVTVVGYRTDPRRYRRAFLQAVTGKGVSPSVTAGFRVVDANRLRYRMLPSREAEPVGYLNRGMFVRAYEEKSGWIRIKLHDGNEGWTVAKYLKPLRPGLVTKPKMERLKPLPARNVVLERRRLAERLAEQKRLEKAKEMALAAREAEEEAPPIWSRVDADATADAKSARVPARSRPSPVVESLKSPVAPPSPPLPKPVQSRAKERVVAAPQAERRVDDLVVPAEMPTLEAETTPVVPRDNNGITWSSLPMDAPLGEATTKKSDAPKSETHADAAPSQQELAKKAVVSSGKWSPRKGLWKMTTARLRMRVAPGVDAPHISTLSRWLVGPVKVKEKRFGWSHIELHDGRSGWVSSEFLEEIQ
ncbi:MAG: SH3 domain-containing protein [Magnetococcales bacterium]|nr:SH3 domain-containing protein [Magnetococcales bacterium]